MKRIPLFTGMLLLLGFAGAASAQNPCNPCGGKSSVHGEHAMNPCSMQKVAINPCDAKLGTVFYIDDPMSRNVVTFESKAPLEDIIGTSNHVTGYIVFDPKHPKSGVRGKLMVPVASLTTGIPMRDEHLQSETWLNAAAHPYISMTIRKASTIRTVKSTKEFATYAMKVEGEFSMNGHTKKISIPVKVTYLKESENTQMKLPGDLLAGRAEFELALADFGIKGMKGVIGSKVSETISVKLSFMGSSQASQMAMNPCNPCNPCGGHKKMNACNPCGE